MQPLLFESIPAYFAMWGVAATVGIFLGTWIATKAGFPKWRSALAICLCALVILFGSKLLYLIEAIFFPNDDYVPISVRSPFHGFRIPGGIMLLAAAMPLICGVLQLSWRRFGDTVIPMVALALVFIRLGCFLNGCCFGKVSDLPWAITFPEGSWVYWYHGTHAWISPEDPTSLPVHPLQLYLAAAAAGNLLVLLWIRKGGVLSGHTQMVFYILFFGTAAGLEPVRQNFLTLNNWLEPASLVASLGLLIVVTIHDRLCVQHAARSVTV